MLKNMFKNMYFTTFSLFFSCNTIFDKRVCLSEKVIVKKWRFSKINVNVIGKHISFSFFVSVKRRRTMPIIMTSLQVFLALFRQL